MTQRLNIGNHFRCSNCTTFVQPDAFQCWACEEVFDNVKEKTGKKKVSKKSKTKLICPACKAKQKHEDAMYCIKCGADLFPKEKKKIKECPSCNTHYEMSDKFCDKDGEKLKIIEIEVEDDANPNVEVAKSSSVSNSTEKVQQNDKNADEELPMNWYSFATYIMCPIGIIGSILLVFQLSGYREDFLISSLLFNALLLGVLMYGLHIKTTWSWKLLLGLYVLNSLIGRIEKLYEWGPFSYLLFVLVVSAITTYPNYIYFNKRKHLFVN